MTTFRFRQRARRSRLARTLTILKVDLQSRNKDIFLSVRTFCVRFTSATRYFRSCLVSSVLSDAVLLLLALRDEVFRLNLLPIISTHDPIILLRCDPGRRLCNTVRTCTNFFRLSSSLLIHDETILSRWAWSLPGWLRPSSTRHAFVLKGLMRIKNIYNWWQGALKLFWRFVIAQPHTYTFYAGFFI